MEKVYAIYEKIKLSVQEKIHGGILKPGDRIPSEIELANRFNASRMTANRALKELSMEGLIVRVQGVGSFVAEPKPDVALFKITSIAQEIEKWGGVHSSDMILLEKEDASGKIAEKLNMEEGDKVFHSIFLHRDRGIPVQYAEKFINPLVAPHYLDQDFSTKTPSRYLLSIAPVQEAEYTIEAVMPMEKIRTLLSIDPGEPCISLKRRTWSFDLVATWSIIIYPGSKYKLSGRLERGMK